MTGLLGGAAKALAVGGLAASGALIAQDHFNNGSVDTVSRIAITADAGADTDGQATVVADAGLSAGVGADLGAVTADGCSFNCIAPCSAGCTDFPSLPPNDVAATGHAVVNTAAAPGQSCGCASSGPAINFDADASADANLSSGFVTGGLSGSVSLGK